MEECFERYVDDGTEETRDEYDYNMLPEEYEEVYWAQFSYDLTSIIYTRYRTVPEPIEYDVCDYLFSPKLGLGVHKRIGFAVVCRIGCFQNLSGKTIYIKNHTKNNTD